MATLLGVCMSHQQKSRCIRFEKKSQVRSERRKIHGILEDVRRSGQLEEYSECTAEDILRAS